MIKILELIFGTTDYTIIIAGFFIAFIAALYSKISDKKCSIREVILTIISIYLVMRFYSFIFSFLQMEIGMVDTMISAFISGLFSRKILDKFKKEIEEHINEL